MKRTLALLLLLALALSLAACGKSPSGELPDGMKLGEATDTYTFYIPEDWLFDKTSGIPMAYVSAIDPSNITLVRTESTLTPAAYFDASRPDLAATFTDLVYLDELATDNTTLGGHPAIVRVYTGKLLGVSYTVKQYIAKVEGALYLLTYTAKNEVPSGEKTYYERYEALADDVASVLLFEGTATPPVTEPTEPVTNADGLLLVSDPRISRYSLYVPSTWQADLQNGTTTATREGAVVSVSYEILREENLGAHWNARNEAYGTLLRDYTFLPEECSPFAHTPEEVTVRLDGWQAARYVFTYTRGGKTYKCEKLMTAVGVYVYTLSYTAEYRKGDATCPYTAYGEDFAAICRAFTFD